MKPRHISNAIPRRMDTIQRYLRMHFAKHPEMSYHSCRITGWLALELILLGFRYGCLSLGSRLNQALVSRRGKKAASHLKGGGE